MTVCRIVAEETAACLVHVDAVDAKVADGSFGDARIRLPPEWRGHAHRCTSLLSISVVNLRSDLSIQTLYGIAFSSLFKPTSRGHPPQSLVHVDDCPYIAFVGGQKGRFELLGSLAGWQVFRKASIIRASMPPMPKHAHGKAQFLLNINCWF